MGEFDGIREREEGKKKMPLGMTVLFLGLILSGVVYLYRYTPQTTGWMQQAQYERRMEAHKTAVIAHEVKEAASGIPEPGEAAAKGGAEIYKNDCAMCHGEKLEGGIGPALVGPKFLYGSTLNDHIRIIAKGTENGMPGFEKQLGPVKIRAVAGYMLSQRKK